VTCSSVDVHGVIRNDISLSDLLSDFPADSIQPPAGLESTSKVICSMIVNGYELHDARI
jgi:hypothetical protein